MTCWRRFAFTITLLAGLLILAGQATADGPVVMQAIAPGEPVAAGQTFEVRITLDGAQNLGSFQFALLYDPAVVRAESARLEDFLGSTGRAANPLGPRVDETQGRIMFGAFTLGRGPGPGGSGHLATVIMRALRPGQSSLDLDNAQMTDIAGNTQPLTVEGAAVTVKPGQVSPSGDLASVVVPLAAGGTLLVLAIVAGFLLRRQRRGRGAG